MRTLKSRSLGLLVMFAMNSASPSESLSQATPAIQWQYNYGGSSTESARSIARTVDGGYILAGRAASVDGDVTGNHGEADIWVVKLKPDGTLDWERCYGGTGIEEAFATVQPTSDGGYILAGTSFSNDGDVQCTAPLSPKGWALKLNATGEIEWQRCLGGSGSDQLLGVVELDGGYVFCGGTSSTDGDVIGNQGLSDLWVIRLNSSGGTEWSRCYGGSASDVGRSIAVTSDGGLIICGQTQSNNGLLLGNNPYHTAPGSSTTGWILKTDAQGSIQWQRCVGGFGNDFLFAVAQATDATFWAVGNTYSSNGDVTGNHGGGDAWVVRLGSTGDLLSQRCFGGSNNDQFQDIQLLPNGSALLAGYTSSSDGDVELLRGAVDVWAMQLTPDLAIEWQRTLGGSAADLGYAISDNPSGGAVLAGYSASSDGDLTGNNGNVDLWVVQMEPWIGTSVNDMINDATWKLYPNPTSNMLTLDLGELTGHGWGVTILDAPGRTVFSDAMGPQRTLSMEIEQLRAGTYYVLLRRNEEVRTRRFIKL